jgi:DNA-binding cell septation regulator SpoVG
MLGFLSVGTPSGLVVHSLKLMVGPKGTRWIAMPHIKRRDQEDRPMLGDGGKPIYDAVIEFRDREARDRFGGPVKEAHRAYAVRRLAEGKP